ncbi:MAG TPA: endonuclease/exonuclease/phosphatase family protein [Chitinophagales bacterium]|nr:endonuclease/exonuclease/phosphatase family protein [Chitinophagales bacterium]
MINNPATIKFRMFCENIIGCTALLLLQFAYLPASCEMLDTHSSEYAGHCSHREDSPVTVVMTYNIRYAGAADTGVIKWDRRKFFISSIIRYHQPDIIGLQEVTVSQLLYFDSTLTNFSHAGVGRDDGKQGGEFSPVFFNNNLYEHLGDSTFWLSPTPQQPSRGWDAALPRICTWVKLKDRKSGTVFYVFNTHFDHVGITARQESAKLLLRQINRIAGGLPVILTGDFNSEESAVPIGILTGAKEKRSNALFDAMHISKIPHHGSYATFCGFEVKRGIAGGHIDYIFVSAGIEVLTHATLTDFEGSHFPSDHFPAMSELQLH